MRSRLESTLPGLVDPGARSLGYLGESESLAALGRSLDSLDGAYALPFSLGGPLGGTDEPMPAADGDDEFDGAALAQQLADTIFTDANHEGGGVYRLPADLVCPADPDTGALDADCVATFEQAELRIRVAAAGDGLDFTLLVGPDRDEPVRLELRSDRATVAVDLAEARAALVFLASLDGSELELPDVMEGEIALSLVVLGPDHVSLELATRTAVRVEAELQGGRIELATAAKQPMVALEIDAVVRSIGATLDVGATSLVLPWGMVDVESLAAGTFALALGGVSGQVTVTDGDQTITVENLGLGDSTTTVKLDEFTLAAIDLNASSGRRFDLTIAPSAAGLPSFALTPGFDLSIAVDLSPLAAAGDLVEDFLLDQVYRVALSGSGPTAQPLEPSLDGSFAGGLAILAGELSIGSTAADAAVVVPAGQCLVGDEVTEGEHPILGAFATAACP